MKFTAVIAPRVLKTLGPQQACEAALLEVCEDALWSHTHPKNRERNIRVERVDRATVDIELELNQRDAEIVKDVLHEALMVFFDPDYNSDVDVQINDEL